MIEKYKALEAKYERLKPRHEAYVKMLGELLAVLHADGGHYQYEHGTEKAVEDSITKHYELKRQLAESVSAVQKMAEGQPFDAVVIADAIKRGTFEITKQLAEYKADAERYRNIKPIIDAFPEINPSNYDHEDACNLNAWGVELVLADSR